MSGTGATSGTYWARGGNNTTYTTNNIFGTLWNSPIYTITNGSHRMRVNGNLTTPINLVAKNVGGFVGIAPGGYFASNSPATLLHLFGPDNSGFGIGGGYRSWMNTGMLVNENSDAIYVGMKPEAGTNRSDAVFCWNDDAGAGQDKLRFVFTGAFASANGNGTNPIDPRSLNGYEFMRMSSSPSQTNTSGMPTGNIGIGPVFTDALPPQSRLHMNSEEYWSNWFQMSIAQSTGQTNTDGLKIGILGDHLPAGNNKNGNVFVYNQEQRHLIFSTGHATPANVNSSGSTNERMRITAIGNPTNLNSGAAYGVYNPAGLTTDITRVSISENPGSPVVRPLSLLHLGFDVGVFSPAGSVDGWRPWMDIGTFTGGGSDNVYVGLKQEGSGDRNDAVVSWGDNQSATPGPFFGPDNLRFIFTANASIPGGSSPATGVNGLETGRFYPGRDTLGTFGRFGVGDFTATGVNQAPTHKIDVVGNGRFRFLPNAIYQKTAAVNKVVFVDSAGVLRWQYADSLNVSGGFGSACGDPSAALTANRQLPLAGYNVYFTGQGIPTSNAIGLGYACGSAMPAKLSILQQNAAPVGVSTAASAAINSDVAGVDLRTYRGVAGNANGIQPAFYKITNVGGDFRGSDAFTSIGVRGMADYVTQADKTAMGGAFYARGANSFNIGVRGEANNAAGSNYAVYGVSAGTSGVNYGGRFEAGGAAVPNYAVYAETDTTATGNYAGYFVGDVLVTGAIINPSDVNLKEHIDTIRNADSLLSLLRPVYFNYKQTGNAAALNLNPLRQMGLIAQEVEAVIPAIVKDVLHPAVYDSAGTAVHPSFTYKTVDYEKIIPLLVGGYKGQQLEIDSLLKNDRLQDSVNRYVQAQNANLQSQLDALTDRINACCSGRQAQADAHPDAVSINIELKDGQSIVLEQNVPNPFAEQTTISYYLPDNTGKAQLLFYNAQGKLIQSAELVQKGKGQLNVFAGDLSSGMYTYTLVVDGKIIESKKMMKQ
jgi:hypothetical protein